MKTLSKLFHKYRYDLFYCAILGAIVFFLQGHLLFTSEYVISADNHDTQNLFFYMQDLAQEGLRHGEIIKWNPYMFGGMPFLGESQQLQFYPIRWILCILPTAQMINWYYFLHIWLMGATMYCWMRFRGLCPMSALVAGTAIMLSGTFYLHQMAGHMVMGSYAWAPVVFLAIDGWLRQRNPWWIILAAAAAAMQIFTGFIQIFYFTALYSGLYSLFNLFKHKRPVMTAIGLAAIYPIALMLSAVQFLPSVGATIEGVRSHGITFDNPMGVPPENLLLILAPWLYGGGPGIDFWGRVAGIHEVLLFSGCGAMFLAAISFYPASWSERIKRLVLILVPLVIAMGSFTPLYKLAYDYIPLYSLFRSVFRVGFISGVFVAFSAAEGLNYIIEQRRVPRGVIATFAVLGVVMFIAGATITSGDGSWFHTLIRKINAPPLHYHQAALDSADKLAAAIQGASISCFTSGFWMILFAALGLIARKSIARLLIPACCIIELVMFAMPSAKSFPIQKTKDEALSLFLRQNPGDYRSVFGFNCQYMGLKAEALWGTNATLMRRYAELVYHSQGYDPDKVSMDINIRKTARTWDLLRIKYVMTRTQTGTGMQQIGNPFPRFFIAGKYRVMHDRNSILATLESPIFDLKNEVVLESDPGVPSIDAPITSQIDIIESTTDKWVINVSLDKPGILVMTDSYSNGWRAIGLNQSGQNNYKVLPADYALRGIPLQAGTHKIKIEYIPWGYYPGMILTIVTLLIIILLAIYQHRAQNSFFNFRL